MHDMTPDRPDWACQLHLPPVDGFPWMPADDGYRTCSTCLDRLRTALKDIARRYLMLDATPGASGETTGRGAPGFGSRPGASLHIVAMRDRRSRSYDVAVDGWQYIYDPLADTGLEPGQYGPPAGAYVEKIEVWYGADGRGHREDPRPVLSVPFTLASLAFLVAEERDMTEPAGPVPALVDWLDRQLDWVTRQDLVTAFAEDIHTLQAQLKPVTGDPARRHIGTCPNTLDDQGSRMCGAKLYAPLRDDIIVCRACGRRWERHEWLRLADLLESA